ncbi:hypothetical protein J437_LFUL008987 [Ladona fulva]|uniref:DNA polymerase theta n=1 Tax=Ladona fulva TaxID=123851 RepID=A0A8K0NXX6_LADFU|nr:hypothetical protein J437_LFUL008987 [Ladona fulva]
MWPNCTLQVIASGVASSPKDIESYAGFTLLTAAIKEEMSELVPKLHFVEWTLLDDSVCSEVSEFAYIKFNRLKKKLEKLCADQLPTRYKNERKFKNAVESKEEVSHFRLIENDGEVKYTATALGEACLAASLPPDQALSLFEELQRARRCFVLEDELHIVTPFSVADQWGNNLDWLRMLNMWQLLSPSMQRVGELVGVEERFMVRAMRGSLNIKAPKQMEKMAIHRRFYTALALQELANEVPLSDVAQKYGCSRGMLQNLQQSAATFAGMVTQFCQRLRWTGLELLASQFQDRLQFGIRRELCDLMRLPMMDGQCARALFDAGIETLAMLAVDASPETIEDALRSYIPFQRKDFNLLLMDRILVMDFRYPGSLLYILLKTCNEDHVGR